MDGVGDDVSSFGRIEYLRGDLRRGEVVGEYANWVKSRDPNDTFCLTFWLSLSDSITWEDTTSKAPPSATFLVWVVV
jgi:hypothetical protein